jgi:hypothetical protein
MRVLRQKIALGFARRLPNGGTLQIPQLARSAREGSATIGQKRLNL